MDNCHLPKTPFHHLSLTHFCTNYHNSKNLKALNSEHQGCSNIAFESRPLSFQLTNGVYFLMHNGALIILVLTFENR
jgi:hypothetical protein